MNTKPKILYVDDEQINLMLFEVNFNEQYEVLTASDGAEGLRTLDEHTDVLIIISDMKMPGMNGLEFIKKAKASYPDKKFYILTGFEITDEIKEALETGLIIEYFSKPFDIETMHNKIAGAIKN